MLLLSLLCLGVLVFRAITLGLLLRPLAVSVLFTFVEIPHLAMLIMLMGNLLLFLLKAGLPLASVLVLIRLLDCGLPLLVRFLRLGLLEDLRLKRREALKSAAHLSSAGSSPLPY